VAILLLFYPELKFHKSKAKKACMRTLKLWQQQLQQQQLQQQQQQK
jgi:hypothetical protein